MDELVDAGLSGLVLELGAHHPSAPAVVIDAARDRGLALIVLHREVKFVSLTEAVHGRIISAQTEALRARDEVRERFTALSLRGAPADFIVHQLAQTLGAPVILENLAHEIVAGEVPPALEEELFTGWELRSRAAQRPPRAGDAAGDWLIVPVEARGIRWGSLIALPGPPHPAGRAAVLEQGAIALAIGRLADGDADEWSRIGRAQAARRAARGTLRRDRGRRGPPRGGGAAGRRALCCTDSSSRARSSRPAAADAAARLLNGRALAGSGPEGLSAPAATVLLSLPDAVGFDDADRAPVRPRAGRR